MQQLSSLPRKVEVSTTLLLILFIRKGAALVQARSKTGNYNEKVGTCGVKKDASKVHKFSRSRNFHVRGTYFQVSWPRSEILGKKFRVIIQNEPNKVLSNNFQFDGRSPWVKIGYFMRFSEQITSVSKKPEFIFAIGRCLPNFAELIFVILR